MKFENKFILTILIHDIFSKYSQFIKLIIKIICNISELKKPIIEIIKKVNRIVPKSARSTVDGTFSLATVIIETVHAKNNIININLNTPASDFMYEQLKKGIAGGKGIANGWLFIENKFVEAFGVDVVDFDKFGCILAIICLF